MLHLVLYKHNVGTAKNVLEVSKGPHGISAGDVIVSLPRMYQQPYFLQQRRLQSQTAVRLASHDGTTESQAGEGGEGEGGGGGGQGHLVITTSVQVPIGASSSTVNAASTVRFADMGDELQGGSVPHLEGATVADRVQEILVPHDGRNPVCVGLVTSRCWCQLTFLADVPGPERPENLIRTHGTTTSNLLVSIKYGFILLGHVACRC